MHQKIKLSIIIINFNTYNFLNGCLRSIYEGDFSLKNLEIIVVDNASKDNPKTFLSRNYSEVKLIVNKDNLGFAKANNQGIKYSQGEYILLLNPDTVVPKNTLKEMISYMDRNISIGVSSCRVELTDGKLDDACHRGFPTPWNAFCHFSGLANLFPYTFLNGYHLEYKDLEKVHEVEAVAGAFMLIRRKAGEEVGWLDEDYFWYGEDLDFCYKVKQAGWTIMFVPYVRILHYKGIAGGIKKHTEDISTADRETRILATRARFEVMRIFYQKHYKDKYPRWLTNLVFGGIRIKEWLNLFALKYLIWKFYL